MIQGRWFPQGSDIAVPVTLRQEVFSRGRDGLDEEAQQVVVYEDGLPVGAARLWWAEGAFHMGDVGVLMEARGKGYGDLLVRLVLHKALAHHARLVRLMAPSHVAPFFARFGFQGQEEGSRDWRGREGAPIPMTLRGEDIALGGCGKGCEACGQGTGEACPEP